MEPKYISLDPLLPWLRLPKPIDWDQVFGSHRPIEVEIGFGRGDYLVSRAKENFLHNFVGIEVGWISIRKALRAISKEAISNVKLIQSDARVAFEWLFGQESIQRIYSLFPCPWPKKRHQKHRLFSRDFLRLLNSRLETGGEIMLVTDHGPFCEWVMEQAQGTGLALELETIGPSFGTKYEKKWSRLGQKEFFQLTFHKVEHLDIEEKKEIALKTHRVADFFPEKLILRGHKDGAVVVEFKETIYDPVRKKAMIRAFVAEGAFTQDFWIQVVNRGDYWLVGPAKGSSIVPTWGVQKAVDLVFEAIVSQQEVISH